MSKFFKVVLAVITAVVLVGIYPAIEIYSELKKGSSEDPLVWERDIVALEEKTAGKYPAETGVVFVGSSSIRLWSSLENDMAPIPVVQHGFGGAKLNDVVHYADRLVSNYKPAAVVLFAGTNDLHPGATKEPSVLLKSYQDFVFKVRRVQPEPPIFYIAITPSVLRWSTWELARETNDLIKDWSATQEGIYVIDTSEALLGDTGEPDPDNYIIDGLHLSALGYQKWTGLIRPVLLRELNFPDS